jgi:hypothetical protein
MVSNANKVMKFKSGKAIRHMEENTTKEHPFKLIPWKVTLGIIKDNIDIRAHEWDYYVRAPDPGLAAEFASMFWRKCEKRYWGIPDSMQFPDTMGNQLVERLPEDEWQSLWKYAKNIKAPGEVEFGGPRKSPSVFTFWPEGRQKPGFCDNLVQQAKEMEYSGLILPANYR